MPTQKGGYYLRDGTRVPSVTTIIGRFKESGGLIAWAWQQGKDGKDFRQTRDQAADAGTLAHQEVENWIKGQPHQWQGEVEIVDKAKKSFSAFEEWRDQTQLRITETETPLVSEVHRFGGTFDAMLVKNQRALGDWKTSNGIYPDYLVQLGGYSLLWEENFPDDPILGGYHLLRFDKTYGDFHHHYWTELESAKKAFLLLRQLYELDKELKQRAK